MLLTMSVNYKDIYVKEMVATDIALTHYNSRVRHYSLLRLIWFFLGLIIIWWSFALESILTTELLFVAYVLIFGFLVKWHAGYERKADYYRALKRVLQNEIDMIGGGKNMYDAGQQFQDGAHAYSADLDIFGSYSLFHIANRCITYFGKQALAGYFTAPANAAEILRRQDALSELSSLRVDTVKWQTVLLQADEQTKGNEIERLFSFLSLTSPPVFRKLHSFVKYQPYVMGLLLAGWLLFPPAGLLLLAVALANIVVVFYFQGLINKMASMVSSMGNTFDKYAEALTMLEKTDFRSEKLRSLKESLLSRGGLLLSAELRQLSAILQRFDYRLNMFVGIVLNLLLVWDIRQYVAMELWKVRNRDILRKAFEVLGEFEAVNSLAALHCANAHWVLPHIEDSNGYIFKAKGLGHPLIPATDRVLNDYSFENNTIDIITGSNMSGKSTFLRTLGINIVLAMAGAPVCADALTVCHMRVFTYMRIKDSLNDNTSTFKAELNRLAALLNYVKGNEKVFFLIDEMLRGTNSADKYKGSKAIIEQLVAERAVGCVATHDLQIAELEDKYPGYVRNFYFDIQIEGEEMAFDYRLRNGACKTFNASLLLKQLGIEING